MNTRSPTRHVRGFTLIEMVLAVGVMAIVLVVINAAFFTALRLRERTADVVDEAQPVQQAVTFLRRDLLCAVSPVGILSGDFKVGNVSEPNINQSAAIELYTATGALRDSEPWGDVQKVTYELKEPAVRTASGGKDLFRSVTRNLLNTVTPESDDQWVMGGVQDITFECYDGTQWISTWDTTLSNTNLPVAVRVRIQLASGAGDASDQQPIEMVVPIVAQSATNQIQTIASTGN
jgi:general secretion pathway protein J